MWFDALPLPALIAGFLIVAGVIAVVGVQLTGKADQLADETGIGEAITGAVLLGMATSLSGTVVSVTAALDGEASLAFSNAVGGIAAQTAFLALADMVYRKANLEHASADLANLYQASLLTLMLGLPLAAFTMPEVSVLGMHPVSFVLPVIYVAGVRIAARVRAAPMWYPVQTLYTRADRPDEAPEHARGPIPLLARFALLACVLGLAGWMMSKIGVQLSARLGISATVVGALMTAVATSLPELITTLAAVRRGAVQLAVGGIIGGNTFDVLFLTAADAGYREGSIYHAITTADLFWIAVGLVMTSILLIGLIVRERDGPGRIGVESTALLLIYGGAVTVQALAG
ncbi:cation:H+ antiporter [Roseovarius litoreus]|uniref:Cation:H+ antiporter n=1 Tax=Roseovarius litoreus TaxID=1155722 RepID=A0A1M6ZF14_9RHOB|nr:sodium:calcium antiporter [Roseovarius litoreus]SHL29037.1 cation:H+ antiporter [Roseovarius litoreus]